MLPQAADFRDESEAVFSLLDALGDDVWSTPTQFKAWTVNDVIAHLHFGNYAADLSFRDRSAFRDFVEYFASGSKSQGHLAFTHVWLDGLRDRALLQHWRDFSLEMADRFADADPKRRVEWFGPDMSVRSSITARQMETWAHSQALYDVLGRTRTEADRIKNVVVMGANTFGWTFENRKLPVPADAPHLRLTAPSGAVWEWNPPSENNRIEGSAVEFCRVVTQVRNVADTALRVSGDTATAWMAMAQCFAGPPEDPPAPGSRCGRT